MSRWEILLRSAFARTFAVLCAAAACGACVDPLGIDTPRRITEINLDSIVRTPEFVQGNGDTIFARVAGVERTFASEVLRPVFRNGKYGDSWYVTVQATRAGLNGPDYEVLSLRLDAISDTGQRGFNAPYSVPKSVDTLSGAVCAAQYDRKHNGSFPEVYRTGDARSNGAIRVAVIDRARGVISGTFEFRGYCAERDSVVLIDHGGFRLQLRP